MPRIMVWSVACRENSNIPARAFSRIAAVMSPGCWLAIVALLQTPHVGDPALHQDGREVGLGHAVSEGAVAEYYSGVVRGLKLRLPVAGRGKPLMAMLPTITIFIAPQRFPIRILSSGAVKG